MAKDCARSIHQDGHRLCYINTSGWPQTVLHQHFRMATDCARSIHQGGHRLLHQEFRMAIDCATFSLIPSNVGKVSTVLPSINKMQFFLFHVSRLTASVSQSVNFVYAEPVL